MTVATPRDRQRWARRASTAARGYGTAHQAIRRARLAQYRPGDLCAIGGEPMLWWPLSVARRYIDLPHDHVNGGYLPGLACRYHNRKDSADRLNRARRAARTWPSARQW